jgi:hypothetical protein
MSGRTIRNIFIGLALVVACTLAAPAPTEAAGLRGAAVPSIQGSSWDWLDSLWSEVGKALNTFFPQQPNQGAPAPAARTGDKKEQGTGVDPNGPPGGSATIASGICDPTLGICGGVAIAVQ